MGSKKTKCECNRQQSNEDGNDRCKRTNRIVWIVTERNGVSQPGQMLERHKKSKERDRCADAPQGRALFRPLHRFYRRFGGDQSELDARFALLAQLVERARDHLAGMLVEIETFDDL